MASDSRNARPERRGPDRIALPACPQCSGKDITVTDRPGLTVHLRCGKCLFVWSVPKHTPAPPRRR